MPSDAPAVKRDRDRRLRRRSRPLRPRRATTARRSAGGSPRERGLTLIPPYDHPHVIAGQGTAARELIRRRRRRSTSSSSRAAAAACSRAPRSPPTRCRPTAGRSASSRPRATMRRDRSGRRQLQTVHNPKTVADGARTPSLGSLTFPLVLQHVGDMTTVDDRDAARRRCSICGSG